MHASWDSTETDFIESWLKRVKTVIRPFCEPQIDLTLVLLPQGCHWGKVHCFIYSSLKTSENERVLMCRYHEAVNYNCLGSFFVSVANLWPTKNQSALNPHNSALLFFVSLTRFGPKQIILSTHTSVLHYVRTKLPTNSVPEARPCKESK